MKSLRRPLVAAIFLTACAMVSLAPTIHAAPLQKATSANQTAISCSVDTKRVHISDADAREHASKVFGAAEIARRVRYTSACFTPDVPSLTSFVTQYSSSWGGYISDILNTIYYAQIVGGSFNVTSYTGLRPVVASWIGIGGYYGNQHLIQAGVTTSQFGLTGRKIFEELYPAGPSLLWDAPTGDIVNVYIHLDKATGNWEIIIDDSATTFYEDDEFSFDPDMNTAEWIEERAPSTTGAVPSNVGQVHFTGAAWNTEQISQVVQPIDSSEVDIVRKSLMKDSVNRTYECLVPGGIVDGYNESNFYINYQSSC